MIEIRLHTTELTRFSLVFTRKGLFHFSFKIQNIAFNYRNPLKCLRLAIDELEKEYKSEMDKNANLLAKYKKKLEGI